MSETKRPAEAGSEVTAGGELLMGEAGPPVSLHGPKGEAHTGMGSTGGEADLPSSSLEGLLVSVMNMPLGPILPPVQRGDVSPPLVFLLEESVTSLPGFSGGGGLSP